jgi:hypothetical protein
MANQQAMQSRLPTHFMLNGVPLLLRGAMHVHIVLPVLHYKLLEFTDTLKLQQTEHIN